MDKKLRQNLGLITFGVILFAAVMNFNHVCKFLQNTAGIFLPLMIGFLLAFVLSVPMKGFEKLLKKICRKANIRLREKNVPLISLLLTLFSIILILVLVCTLVIPQIVISVKSIADLLQEKWPEWAVILKSYNIDTAPIAKWMKNLDIQNLIKNIASNAGVVLNTIAGTAASTVSGIVTAGIAFVITFYVLLSKKDLTRQSKKLLYAYLKKEWADQIISVARLANEIYTKFFSGQCVESVILGVLMFLAFTIFRLPYAGLIAVLTCVCAFIPYIGAFFSCGVGVLLTLISSPMQAIMCFIVYQVVQFIENQFIYPRVVGNSVGLSPLLTLLAALFGGKLFGLVGMIFFIPLTAVIYTLIKKHANRKLEEKQITL
ncbi:MAG: AI-2E family transporter [Lachnospiraceae bacterium]